MTEQEMYGVPLISNDSDDGREFDAEFRWYRGRAVAAFAQIEYAIAHLLGKLRLKPEFAAELQTLPYSAESRAQKLRETFENNSSLLEFSSDARTIAENFIVLAPQRNFLAHGFARIDVEGSEVVVRMFRPLKGGDTWNIDAWTIPRSKIVERGLEIEQFTFLVWDFVRRVNEKFQLNF